jgi:hypothetical protein
MNDPKRPELVNILPAGVSPEGVAVLAGRNDGKKLLATANEVDGTINIYSANDAIETPSPKSPMISSHGARCRASPPTGRISIPSLIIIGVRGLAPCGVWGRSPICTNLR